MGVGGSTNVLKKKWIDEKRFVSLEENKRTGETSNRLYTSLTTEAIKAKGSFNWFQKFGTE